MLPVIPTCRLTFILCIHIILNSTLFSLPIHVVIHGVAAFQSIITHQFSGIGFQRTSTNRDITEKCSNLTSSENYTLLNYNLVLTIPHYHSSELLYLRSSPSLTLILINIIIMMNSYIHMCGGECHVAKV